MLNVQLLAVEINMKLFTVPALSDTTVSNLFWFFGIGASAGLTGLDLGLNM